MKERTPIRKSLLRHITWLGGDRRIVGISAFVLVLLGYTLFYSYGIFYGVPFIVPLVFFLVILWVARAMHKADPFMVNIMLRQFRYAKYYAPKSDLRVEHPEVRDFT